MRHFERLLIITLILIPLKSFAVQSIQPLFTVPGIPRIAAQNAQRYFLNQDPGERVLLQDLQNERNFKNEVLLDILKKAKPGTHFNAQLLRKNADTLEESPLYQSWRDEVGYALDGKLVPHKVYLEKGEDLYHHFYENTPIDIAKKIAKGKMHAAIGDNWEPPKNAKNRIQLKGTNFLRNDFDTWLDAKREAARELDESFTVSPKLHFGNYLFFFPGVGSIDIDKQTLKSGQVIFNVNSDHDVNHLEAGADQYKTDVEAGIAPPPAPPAASPGADQAPLGQ